jgi:hypothetical protein
MTALTDEDLRAWAANIARDLNAAGISGASVRATLGRRRPQRDNPQLAHGAYLALDVPCPNWVRGRASVLEIYHNARTRWTGPEASVREMYLHLCKEVPRWRVPPQGGPPMAVVLTERNGWEGEAWRFAFPISGEAAALELVNLHEPSIGQDMRVTPMCPRSLATFGAWSLGLSYRREEDAIRAAENSRCGYMDYHNWDETAGAELESLLKQARDLGLAFWQRDSGKGGVSMWKAHVRLHDERGEFLADVQLA